MAMEAEEIGLHQVNEVNEKTKDIWFPAKKYGYGWGPPVKWQGWVVLLAYVFLVATGSVFMSASPAYKEWLLPSIVLLTALLIFICWKKGEKTQWPWGKRQ